MTQMDEVARALYIAWGEYEMRHGTTLGFGRAPGAWNCLNLTQQQQWTQVAIAAAQWLSNTFDAREVAEKRDDSGWQAIVSPIRQLEDEAPVDG